MFKNYFKLAFRNLWRNKAFSAINILGLSLGISASLVIFLIVRNDFSFDKFEKGNDRIYRVVTKGDPAPPAFIFDPAVQKQLTGLDLVAPFTPWSFDVKLSVPKTGQQKPSAFLNEPDIVLAGEGYFKLVNYKWLAGSPTSSLSEPFQTVLTEQNARRFFPHLSPDQIIGKEIIINDTIRTTVSGIVANLKSNTDFNFQTFVSRITVATLKPQQHYNWGLGRSMLFIKLSKNTNPEKVRKQVTDLYHLYYTHVNSRRLKVAFALQPLANLHFKTFNDDFGGPRVDITALYGLMAVAAILLLLACINFINLTTAQSSQRAKEIGIRKTLGGSRKKLVFQFLSETFLLTLIATFISTLFAPLLLKAFSGYVPEGIQFNVQQPAVILFLASITVLVSFLAGIYPALILSSYKPVTVLRNQSSVASGNTRNLFFRKTLTVSQFVVAQVFVIATIIMSKQIHYELNKNMGFKKDAIIYFGTNYRDTSVSKRKVLFQEFEAIPGIAKVSLAGFPPSTSGELGMGLTYKTTEEDINTQVRIKPADTNYIKLYHIKLLAGTNLLNSDTISSFVVNEKCAQLLGFKNPQDAVGKYVESNLTRAKIPIVGVVANFIQGSLYDKIQPLVLFNNPGMELTFNVALLPENHDGTSWQNAIEGITKFFKKIYPDTELEIHFLDESIAQYYLRNEKFRSYLNGQQGLR